MMMGRVSANQLVYVLRPAVAEAFQRLWYERWPFREVPKFMLAATLQNDDLIFACPFGRLTLATYHEIDDGSYRHLVRPRFEHWMSKNMPRPHHRYVAKPQIRRPRHPTKED